MKKINSRKVIEWLRDGYKILMVANLAYLGMIILFFLIKPITIVVQLLGLSILTFNLFIIFVALNEIKEDIKEKKQ